MHKTNGLYDSAEHVLYLATTTYKMVANGCPENARILLVNVAYKAEGGAVAHSAQHEEEGIAHHEHIAEEKGRLHEA